MTTKRYTYRAYLTGDQGQAAARLFGCCRVAWNDALAFSNDVYRSSGKSVSSADLSMLLTVSKKTPEREWMNDVSAVPLQQVIADLAKAFGAFFASVSGKRNGPKVRHPKFKKRSHRQSARFTKNARFTVRQTSYGVGFVDLPKIGRIRFALSRPLPSDPSSVTLIQEPDGRFFVSFVVREADPAYGPSPVADERPVAGVDLGLTNLVAVVSSDGSRRSVDNPAFSRTRQVKMARAQRAYSRKKKGSKNQNKARIVVARQHRKIADARADYHRKLALDLVRENQTVAMETLNVRGLARTRQARSVHDAAWSTLVRFVHEASPRYRTEVHQIGRFVPTSQVCSVCRTNSGKKTLDVREWTCDACGSHLDRDYNAAVNIMVEAGLTHAPPLPSSDVAAGLAETQNACGRGGRRDLVPRWRERKTLASVQGGPDEAGIPTCSDDVARVVAA